MDVLILIGLLTVSNALLLIAPANVFYFQIVLNFFIFFLCVFLANRNGYNIYRRLLRMRTFGSILNFAMYMGVLYVVLMVSAGFIQGFGKSPYSHTPLGILLNVLYISSFVLSFEFSRAYAVRRIKKPESAVIVALLYTVIVLLPTLRFLPKSRLGVLKYIGSEVIPVLSQQFFNTLLVYKSGAYASSLYSGITMGFEWLSPVLPKLDWMTSSFIGTLVPSLGYAIMSAETSVRRVRVKKEEDIKSWIVTFVACMLLILFFTGKLGYHPAVVGSGSMSPAIHVGDIVIVKKVNPSNIHVGDIVQYYSGKGYTITHRVIEIRKTPNGLIFVTKGDANNVPDKPFKANRIVGKVVFVIPKIGLIPLIIRDLIRRIVRGG